MSTTMAWTAPIAIMEQVIANVDPSEDFIAVTEAEEAMKQAAARRAKEATDVRDSIRDLSHQLEAARMSATRPRTLPSEAQHTIMLQDLSETQMSLAKGVNEAQDMLRNKETELNRLRTEEKDLEARDEPTAHRLDSTTLRMQFARGLGFRPILDHKGGLDTVLVMSTTNDVHRVPLKEGKSQYAIANDLWRLATS